MKIINTFFWGGDMVCTVSVIVGGFKFAYTKWHGIVPQPPYSCYQSRESLTFGIRW